MTILFSCGILQVMAKRLEQEIMPTVGRRFNRWERLSDIKDKVGLSAMGLLAGISVYYLGEAISLSNPTATNESLSKLAIALLMTTLISGALREIELFTSSRMSSSFRNISVNERRQLVKEVKKFVKSGKSIEELSSDEARGLMAGLAWVNSIPAPAIINFEKA